MKNLEIIDEIKKNENTSLEEIINIFKSNRVDKNVTLHLIRINFNYEYSEILYYLNLIYKDSFKNPFNEDFIKGLDCEE